VVTNHPSATIKADFPMNPLIEGEFQQMQKVNGGRVNLACLPHHVLDSFLSRALTHSIDPVMMQAPLAWVQNGPANRARALNELMSYGKIQIFYFQDREGLHEVVWLMVFPNTEARLQVMPAKHRWTFQPITLEMSMQL
jgi:hypothetical protein